ncbi:MAG: hypothetical protein A2X23_06410 [Chloroflexi bacterium GWC2_73_18]|nr:MAG: hypothetical protein A2X23_06410 [Chloroflexi bacterium GWC2_73_18]
MTDDPLKRGLTAVWDVSAAGYDRLDGHGLLLEDEERAWRRLVAAILGDPRHAAVPVQRVLDVGTGTGFLAIFAAELGHEVTGLDLSESMLALAARKARELHLAIDLHLGDAEVPPFATGSFDVVVSRHLLWTLPHPGEAVARWAELVRPGGLVAVIDGYSPRLDPFRAVLARGARRLGRAIERRRGAPPDHDYTVEQYAALPLARQGDARGAERLLRGAGLERVATRLLREVDTAEARHATRLQQLAYPYRHYLSTGRRPADPVG